MDNTEPGERPEDCGLAIALPLSYHDVKLASVGQSWSDYLSDVSPGEIERVWKEQEPAANALLNLVRSARNFGVDVDERATLCTIRQFFSTKSIVTVVAHWRGAVLSETDIKLDAAHVIDGLRAATNPFAEALLSDLTIERLHEIESLPTETGRRRALAGALDQRLRGTPYLPGAAPSLPPEVKYQMDASTRHHRHRELLDRWWPQAFKSGSRLELEDGLHSAESVGAVIPSDWSGTFDLSSCYSAQLVGAIKQGRQDRISIANDEQVEPRVRPLIIDATYKLLADGGWGYSEARLRIAQGLILGSEESKPKRTIWNAIWGL